MGWEPQPPGPAGRLGDWYATFLTGRPQHIAICVNGASLLVVLVPITPLASFRERLRAAAVRRLWEIPAAHQAVFNEERALDQFAIRPTQSRSVLGSLNNLAMLARHHLAANPHRHLDELGRFLCDTPMFALSTAWPWKEAELLLGREYPTLGVSSPDAT